MPQNVFQEEYKKLNKFQKEAVDSTDGPVMVVAGPGTGKTQVLALRIANILTQTDTGASGILCLTFTNSGVEAMKKRLVAYIGQAGERVNVATFHSFGMQVIEEYFSELGLKTAPKLLDDTDASLLFDEILEDNEWQYLRPRADRVRYFKDLKSLISLLKRELIGPEEFQKKVEKAIKEEENDPDNISTRGESKGQIKKEAVSKIEGLHRLKEVAIFYNLYQQAKNSSNLFDYDDVLENLVKLVKKSKDTVAEIRERYLYVLVDEHQDSSRVQNEFLEQVWGKVEVPNIFVVGDDRQLIYGFSGASIEYFQAFQKVFKGARLISLVDNYRSTQVILDTSHLLLESVLTKGKLVSQSNEAHPIKLVEAEREADEILACAKDIKAKIKEGVDINECAILVPKNKHVREALNILHSEGLKVASLEALNLFEQESALAFIRILRILSDPNDSSSLALSFFDKISSIPPLVAHEYISSQYMREFSFGKVLSETKQTLFGASGIAEAWVGKLSKWSKEAQKKDVTELITIIKDDLLDSESEEGVLVTNEEVFTQILGLALKEKEKNPNVTLKDFVNFLNRLESYNEHIPLIVNPKEGVKVLTLHSSKGLEFDYVWIAHMNEKSLNSGKRMAFTLPGDIGDLMNEKDEDKAKRTLYVAITRAKRFCTISYSLYSSSGTSMELATIIKDLPGEVFTKETVESLLEERPGEHSMVKDLKKMVGKKYVDRYVSVSLLNNFFECPWKWYFKNILQIPEPGAEILEFGVAVHAVIEHVLKSEDTNNIKDIIADKVAGIVSNKKAIKRISKEIESIILPWIENRLPEIKLNRKTEESISTKDAHFPHLKLFGVIDLIENLSREEIRVTDFKTGSPKRKSEIEKKDDEGRMSNLMRQLAMYSYLLQNNPKWGNVDVRESRLEFLEAKSIKESIYHHVVGKEELSLLQKDIADYDYLAKNGGWVDRPCNYNSYGKNTTCPYCKLGQLFKS